MMKYPFTLIYLISSLIIIVLPFYWWTYNFGGLVVIETSPFQVSIYFLGTFLKISYVISAALEAFRIFLIIAISRDIYLLLKGKTIRNRTLPTLTVSYLVYPIIIYIVITYLMSSHGIDSNYSFLEIGQELVSVKYENANLLLTFAFYPQVIYWIALAISLLFIPSYLETRKLKK
jgi:hypothetical protein